MMDRPIKHYSATQAIEKIKSYCAYQERAHQEVKSKLYSYGLYSNEVDEIISQLITDGFLNEERFAKAYAGGKFRMKKWGRLKIINNLKGFDVSKNCIKTALKEIPEDDYAESLNGLLQKKLDQLDEENPFTLKDKLSKYAIQKGYEPDLVWKTLKALIPY